VFGPETTAAIEGGWSLIAGTVGADGEPTAARCWGITVLSRERGECRLLFDANATRTHADLAATGVIAITAGDVSTLRSIQMKGVMSSPVEPATPDEVTRAAEFADAFFGEIVKTDGSPRDLLQHMFPDAFVACTAWFTELYDQTPGPVAGAAIDEALA